MLVDAVPWYAEVGDLLTRAAMLSVKHGLDPEAFMCGAWSAYVDTRPGFREYLEEQLLRARLEEARKNGNVGEA
ncbi:MAG: hypothetical protein H0T79_19565 [Deltaproteobacteria bacterium]|nr:hypothetical protein [Deltaproteobacteria bacterium]